MFFFALSAECTPNDKSTYLLIECCKLTNASANAVSASLLCCKIFWARTGLDAGLRGGLSLPRRNRPKVDRFGLVSRDVSRDPVVDLGMPEESLRGLGESCSVDRLYK